MPPIRENTYWLLLLLLCLNLLPAKGQNDGFFDRVWLDDGLSQSSVMAITQDKEGMMWFGTQVGLNRYDGRQIENFSFQPFNPSSICGDNIQTLCADTGNAIWSLNKTGLDYFNYKTRIAFNVSSLLKENKKKSRFINRIWMLNGKLYMTTAIGFAELIRKGEKDFSLNLYTIQQQHKEKQLHIFCAVWKNKQLYLSTDQGLYNCPDGQNTFSLLQPANADRETKNILAGETLLLFCNQDILFFSQENTLYALNEASGSLSSFSTCAVSSSGKINTGICDRQNTVWIGTQAQGLYLLNNCNGKLSLKAHFMHSNKNRFGLKSDQISFLYQSKHSDEDIVWIGSHDAGVFSYSYTKNSFQLISAFIPEENMNFFGVVKDHDGIIWTGTNTRVYKIDRKTNTTAFIDVSNYVQLSARPFEAMFCDEQNDIWMGNGNYLFKVDKKNNRLITQHEHLSDEPKNTVLRICALNTNELLLATWQGLVIYNKITGETTHITELTVKGKPLKLGGVGCVYPDSKQQVWIGADKGLFCWNRRTQNADYYAYAPDKRESLLSSTVMDIKETAGGELLIATTKGLSILKDAEAGIFENYYQPEGLLNNFLYGILPDSSGRLWMTTNYGIGVFDPVRRSFHTYSAREGTYINEFNSGGFYAASDGELLFGGLGGFVGVYPGKLAHFTPVPPLILRSFKINQQKADTLLAAGIGLNLPHTQNQLDFEFSVPDFSTNRNIRLMYRLDSTWKNWIAVDNGFFILLPNLAPGKYTLQVKAVNANGQESQHYFQLPFTIQAPFWATWWFYTLVLLILFLLGWLIYRSRFNRKIVLLKQMEQIRLEENEKVRKAAALDLHDEFGNGLTRISMLVEMAKIKMTGKDEESLKLLQIISENSSRLYQGTKDFIWSINPGNDNLYELIIRVKDFGDELFYGTGISFDAEGLREKHKEMRHLPGSGRNLVMIFKEALSNVLKHAGARKVKLCVEESDDYILIRLRDDGLGFDEKSKNGFGLSNMRQRALRAGVTFELYSGSGKGTEIILQLNKEKLTNTIAHE